MGSYVLSDIHGMRRQFNDILDQIGFSGGDMLYVLGDVADRGPDGVAVLEQITGMKNAILLQGNHENMWRSSYTDLCRNKWRKLWMQNGGGPTLEAFEKLDKDRQDRILDYLSGRPDHMIVTIGDKQFALVHAYWGYDGQDKLWRRPSAWMPMQGPVFNGSIIVGHTPVFLLQPDPANYLAKCKDHVSIFHGQYFTDIDCGAGVAGRAYRKCCLGCMRLDDGAEFYAL